MAIAHPKYKVAAVQAAPAFLDLEASVDKTIRLIDEAGAAGARLIAFPETWIPGYPWWIWLGAPAWAIMRGFVSRYFDNSLHYDSPEAERLRAAAKRTKAGYTALLRLLWAAQPKDAARIPGRIAGASPPNRHRVPGR